MSRGGGSNARGGPLRGGKSGFMGGNRGGNMGNRGGRGGGNMYGGGNRGGAGGGQQLKGHGSRGGFYGNKDFHNRRGGSFNSGHSHHHPSQQQNSSNNSSFRGRGQGHFTHTNRGGRHDFGSREPTLVSSVNSSVGKKEENRRTLTDFKIVGLEIKDLGWTWGSVPSTVSVKTESKPGPTGSPEDSHITVKTESGETDTSGQRASGSIVKSNAAPPATDAASSDIKPPAPTPLGPSNSVSSLAADQSPPSRLRIYFHTPVSADDSHPISLTSSFSAGASATSDVRKGKRKKLEDDDGDLEEQRARPPPIMSGDMAELDTGSVSAVGDMDITARSSVAPSVTETASEGDWLMAAIGEDEGDDEQMHAHEGDPEGTQWTQNAEDGNAETVAEGDGHDGDPSPDEPMTNGVDAQEHVDQEAAAAGAPPLNDGGADEPAQSQADGPSTTENFEDSNASGAPAAPTDHQMTIEGDTAPPGSPADAVHRNTDAATNGVGSEGPYARDDGHDSDNAQRNDPTSPLEPSPSFASTVPEFYQQTQTQDVTNSEISGKQDTDENGYYTQDPSGDSEQTQAETQTQYESPASNSLASSATLTLADLGPTEVPKEPKGPKMPSANRLSISYASGTRRLVVDAEIVDKLKVYRAEGRIEVFISLEREETDDLKGILIEGLSDTTRSYLPLPTLGDAPNSDPSLPPFSKAAIPSQLMMAVYLDTERPLSEPKWVKSGDVQEWLKSMFGRMFWVAGDAADGWERRIEVVDPDPAPTIWTVLEGWAANSPVGTSIERQRFLRTHMTETDNIMEILLRLVRGERATPFSTTSSSISAQSVSGPLLAALSPGSPHGAQQTHVSLAVLAIFRMAVEYAKKAVGDKGKGEAEERVGEIIRCLPSHLLYKSLDGIFKEWKVDKKGGR